MDDSPFIFDAERVLFIDVHAGADLRVTPQFTSDQGALAALTLNEPSIDQPARFSVSPPLPSVVKVELSLSGAPGRPVFLALTFRQGRAKGQTRFAKTILDREGHQILSYSGHAKVREQRIGSAPSMYGIDPGLVEALGPRLLASSSATMIERVVETAAYKWQVALTPAARMMLVLPIAEQSSLDAHINPEELRRSVDDVMTELARTPDARDAVTLGRRRSAVSVIRAFAARFCRIPPFCGPAGPTPPPGAGAEDARP